MPERNRHTTSAAWRLVVETWLRRQGWISVKEKQQTNVSTDSKPSFSQLCPTNKDINNEGTATINTTASTMTGNEPYHSNSYSPGGLGSAKPHVLWDRAAR